MILQHLCQKKVRSCNYKLRNLWHIRNCLPLNSRVIMVTNLIISNLDYSNSLLACASDKTIKPLQVILNKAMRFIFNIPPHSHTTPYLRQLHILPIKYRIKFKITFIAFKIFNKTAPAYLSDDFNKYSQTTEMNLRRGTGRDEFMFCVSIPPHKRDTLHYKIKTEWNSLPLNIRKIKTISSFKTMLKTHLFRLAFPDS